MNMAIKLNCLVVWCFTLINMCKGGQDGSASCEIMLKVRRGVVFSVAPTNALTVSCSVKNCGEPLNVTWCKLLRNITCEEINNAENVQIRQTHEMGGLISYLSFKQVSADDDGLYRCVSIRRKLLVFSNSINISVSDKIQGVEHFSYRAGESQSTNSNEDDWVPYFSICTSLAFLVTTLTVLTLLCFPGSKRKWTSNSKGEEMPIHMIPTLPKRSVPSAPVLQTHASILSDIYSSCTAETPTSPPFFIPTERQHADTKTAVRGPESENAVYAVISHSQRGTPAINLHATSKKDKNPTYAVINLPSRP